MRYFDCLSPIYDHFMPRPDPSVWRDLLRLPSAGPLLDSGGGTGRISAAVRPWVDSAVVADIAHLMLRRARGKGLETVQADAARLPFADATFARIVVADALHHFPEQKAAVNELVRVLAPGGRLVVEEFDIRRVPVKAMAVLEKMLLMGSRFLPAEEIREMLKGRDVRTEIRFEPPFNIWVVADKT